MMKEEVGKRQVHVDAGGPQKIFSEMKAIRDIVPDLPNATSKPQMLDQRHILHHALFDSLISEILLFLKEHREANDRPVNQ